MGLKLENVLTGLILFSILISLIVGASSQIFNLYEIIPDYVDADGLSVMEKLSNINFISGFEEVNNVISAIYDREGSTGSEFDILGSLKASAIGVVKIGTGILTAPLEIIGAVTGFYTIPSSVSVGLGLIIIIYLGYMLINELLGK